MAAVKLGLIVSPAIDQLAVDELAAELGVALAERYPELRWPLLQKYIPSARTRVFSISGYKDLHGGILASSLSCKRRQWRGFRRCGWPSP